MTDADIAEGLRLDAERTPGEWVKHPVRDRSICSGRKAVVEVWSFDVGNDEAWKNLDFIAHAANHYADALREVKRLREKYEPGLADGG